MVQKAKPKAKAKSRKRMSAKELAALCATPQLVGGGPAAPDHLPEEAREIWRQTVAKLREVSALGFEPKLDGVLIEQYVMAVHDYRRTSAFLEKHGHSYENALGNRARHPESTVNKEASQAMERLGTRLGLNPRARQIMGTRNPSERSAFDDDED